MLITINVYTTNMNKMENLFCSNHISFSPFNFCITYLGRLAIYDNKPVTKLCLKFSNVHQYSRVHPVQAICQ